MSNNRAGHAASIVVHRIRQNWRWSKAHSWAHLIEEHDLNPLVRGRRAIRKTWWRLAQRDQKTPACPAVPGGSPTIRHQPAGARPGRVARVPGLQRGQHQGVRELPHSRAADDRSAWSKRAAPGSCCSSRCAIPIARPRLLDYFGPRARAIWAYRSVDGRVRSAVAKFGDSNLRVLRAFAAGEEQKPWNTWQIAGLSAENAEFVRSFDLDSSHGGIRRRPVLVRAERAVFRARAAPADRYHPRQLR